MQTFKESTVKNTFKEAGVWPVSFKAVQKKLKEYSKKKRQDTGLECLEFGSESEAEAEPRPESIQDYQLS